MSTLPLSKAVVKFNSQSQARDKIYRIVQYGCRLALWYLANEERQTAGSLEEKLQKLEAALALSRKLFRMGNSLDLGHRALDALSMPDPVLRKLAVTAHTLKAVWLLLDHVIWCGKIQIVQVDLKFWNTWASWAWLIGLAASTIFDLIKLRQLQTKMDNISLQMETVGRHDLADPIRIEMHTVWLNFWRDLCDLFIPLSSLQYANPGLGAICGLMSSLIGFQLEWEKNVQPFKLK